MLSLLLSNSRQEVKRNDPFSDCLVVCYGVPKRSVLV